MKYESAVKVAIDCMKRRRRVIAVDANLFKLAGMDNPTGRNAAKEYDRITKAMEILASQERLL